MEYTFTTTSQAVLTVRISREEAVKRLIYLQERINECQDGYFNRDTVADCTIEMDTIKKALKALDKIKKP